MDGVDVSNINGLSWIFEKGGKFTREFGFWVNPLRRAVRTLRDERSQGRRAKVRGP